MGAWYIGPDKSEDVYTVLDDAMKCNGILCDDLGRDEWVEFLKAEGRWHDLAGPHTTEHIFFDGGGMVRVDEPTVSWEANSCPMKTRVTHLPFTIEVLQGEPSKELRGDLIMFKGFHRIYALSQKTRDEAVVVMKRLLKGTESLRQELELDTQKSVNGVKHFFSARKCGCLSGKMYVECCGKYVKT